jgi:cytochrome c oxidase cbb3-type subunit III
MKYEDNLLDHNYDGIQELDNNLPPWWLNLFFITIIWGIIYFFYYHVFDAGNLQEAEYKAEMGYVIDEQGSSIFKGYSSPFADKDGSNSAKQPSQPAETVTKTDEQPVQEALPEVKYELVTDAARLENGRKVFTTNCVPCHGALGEGGIGPNFTDSYWINGDGSINAIVHVIQTGVPIKGMISWKPLLPEKDIEDVASYVYNLRGTNPPNPKAPQGENYEE